MARFGRVLTAMVTPFDREGRLDLDVARTLARHLQANGNDGKKPQKFTQSGDSRVVNVPTSATTENIRPKISEATAQMMPNRAPAPSIRLLPHPAPAATIAGRQAAGPRPKA